MKSKCQLWAEEQAFDYVYGKMEANVREEYKAHVATCDACRAFVAEWEQLLVAVDSTARPSERLRRKLAVEAGIKEPYHAREGVIAMEAAVKDSYRSRKSAVTEQKASMSSNKLRSLGKTSVLSGSRKWMISIIGSAAIIFLTFGTYLFTTMSSEAPHVDRVENGAYSITQQHDVRKAELVNDPETNRFHITPVATTNDVNGAVYVNDVTNELFMHVQGLPPVVEKDYQLWLVHENDDMNSELLEIEDKEAILYYKGDELGDIVLLRVSLERKGGSDEPKGPNTFFVDLKR